MFNTPCKRFIKLPSLMDNPSHPCAIRRPRNSRWHGSNCMAWANAISAKFKGVSIKLTECALDYLLILIKFEGFFIKLPSLLNNPSHPRVIRRPGYFGWCGYKNWRVFAAPRPVGQCGGTHGICLSFLLYENECVWWWLIERIMWELWRKNLIVQHLEL